MGSEASGWNEPEEADGHSFVSSAVTKHMFVPSLQPGPSRS